MTQAQPMWTPTPERARSTQMYQFMLQAADKYGFPADWLSLHTWSVSHRDQFWQAMFDWAAIEAAQPATAVSSGAGMLGTKWFPGMRLNFAAHLLRHDDDRVALEAEDELGRTRSISYRELRAEVARLAAAMRNADVKPGDRVGGYMPNIPEAVMAMLAAASIGAVWSSCSPDFGINGVIDRFGQIEPKLLIAADGYSYNGKTIDSIERICGISAKIPSIERVVIVPFINDSPDLSSLANSCLWSDFQENSTGLEHTAKSCSETPLSSPLSKGGNRGVRRYTKTQSALTFEPLPFDHPLYVMYSSGTTGVPKCIVHGAGGTLLQHMKELMLHCDLRREDTIFYFTTCGWMMWNWLVSGLGVGATVVLYEGAPFHPSPDHLWQMTERLGITVFGTSPKYVSACEKAELVPSKQHDLSRLRAVLSTGSPLTIENFRWVYQNVKDDLQLSSICGGTDIVSCFMLGNPMLPVCPGEIQCLGLGMDVRALDGQGKAIVGEKGELVCCSPFPSQPTGFWKDNNHEKYKKAYFDHFPGIWRHGDFVEITKRGGVIVYGRSDATLNPGGVRIGTAEIYRQVESMEEIVDSVVVGKKTPDADVEVCLFVVLREGVTLDDDMICRIKTRIADGATKRHVPKHIKQVSAVPYTISGKKVEMAVANMIHGEPVLNRDALANPDALEQYFGIL